LNTTVANLEALAGQNIYVEESDGLTVGGVGDVVVDFARFDSGTDQATDADLTGIDADAGVAKLKSAGAVTVSETFTAGTDALVLTTAGDVTLDAALTPAAWAAYFPQGQNWSCIRQSGGSARRLSANSSTLSRAKRMRRRNKVPTEPSSPGSKTDS